MHGVTSAFKEHDGEWSYTVYSDGRPVAQGSGYSSQAAMQAALDRDTLAARRNAETAEIAARLEAARRPAILLLAPSLSIATAAVPLFRALLAAPANIELATVQAPYGDIPEGLRVVGVCAIGVDFSDLDTHAWAYRAVLPLLGRGCIVAGIESPSLPDLVPSGAQHVALFA